MLYPVYSNPLPSNKRGGGGCTQAALLLLFRLLFDYFVLIGPPVKSCKSYVPPVWASCLEPIFQQS